MPAPLKSRATKRLKGTDRADRRAQLPAAGRLDVAPDPPASLSARAAAEWRALAPHAVWLGTLAASDLRGFALLCTTLAREDEASGVIAREGFTVGTTDGGKKAHPALKALEVATSQATRLLSEFGLSPRSRAGMDTAPLGSPGRMAPTAAEGSAPTAPADIEDQRWSRMRTLRSAGGENGT